MRQVMKLVAGTAAALIALFGFAGAAGAQDGYGPPEGCAEFDFDYSARVEAGSELVITNGVGSPGDELTMALGETALGGTLVVDDDGTFAGSLAVPASLAPGTYELSVTCGGVLYEAEDGAPVEVLANSGTNNGGNNGNSSDPFNGGSTNNSGSNPLARTGFDARPVATLGAAALVLGGAALYGSRRRRAIG